MHRRETNDCRAARLKSSPLKVGMILFTNLCISADAEGLVSALVNRDFRIRQRAEEKLIDKGDKGLPVCLEMAASESLSARVCAARVLRRLVSDGLDYQKIKQLKDSDFPELRSIYYSTLPGTKAGIQELLSGVLAPQREIRLACLNRLIELRTEFNPDPLLVLLAGISEEDPHRDPILFGFIFSLPSKSWEVVAKKLSHSDVETVALAAKVLGCWKVSEATQELHRTGIRSSNEKVRGACFSAMASIGEDGRKLILEDCKSEQGHVREQAVLALGFFQNTHKRLLEMLERDPYERVAQAASSSLQRLFKIEEPQYFFSYDSPTAERGRVVKAWKGLLNKGKDR